MRYGASDAARDEHVDEDVAVDQDEAACENGDVGSRVGDEDGVEQEEVPGDHLLSCLYRTLILLFNVQLPISLCKYVSNPLFVLFL